MTHPEIVEGVLVPSTQSQPPLSTLEPEEKCSFTSDEQVVQDWLADKSEHTQKSYFATLQQFLGLIGGKPLRTVAKSDIRMFLDYCLHERANSSDTVNKKLAALKSLFGHCVSEYYRDFNPALNVKSLRQNKADKGMQRKDVKQKVISPQEVRQLIQATNSERDRALFELLYITGMRIHEALGLTWDDIYNNGGDWYVHILGKGHKTRDNKIPLSLYEKLQALETNNYIFLSNRKRPLSGVMAHKAIKGAASRAGIARSVSCHTLRHSHASHALVNGASLVAVRDQLGHSSISVTSQYLHSSESSSDFIQL